MLFFNLKQSISEDYKILFDGSRGSKPRSVAIRELSKRWGWYNTIATLSKDDISKIDKTLEKTVIEVFNFLCYQIDKNEAEEEEYIYQQQLNKVKNKRY